LSLPYPRDCLRKLIAHGGSQVEIDPDSIDRNPDFGRFFDSFDEELID
jgi:hypothetical protein